MDRSRRSRRRRASPTPWSWKTLSWLAIRTSWRCRRGWCRAPRVRQLSPNCRRRSDRVGIVEPARVGRTRRYPADACRARPRRTGAGRAHGTAAARRRAAGGSAGTTASAAAALRERVYRADEKRDGNDRCGHRYPGHWNLRRWNLPFGFQRQHTLLVPRRNNFLASPLNRHVTRGAGGGLGRAQIDRL